MDFGKKCCTSRQQYVLDNDRNKEPKTGTLVKSVRSSPGGCVSALLILTPPRLIQKVRSCVNAK